MTVRRYSKTVTVKLPADLAARLSSAARARGISQSEVIRDALETVTVDEPVLFLDAAAHLIGSCHGPGDLTTNPEYMKDYGR